MVIGVSGEREKKGVESKARDGGSGWWCECSELEGWSSADFGLILASLPRLSLQEPPPATRSIIESGAAMAPRGSGSSALL